MRAARVKLKMTDETAAFVCSFHPELKRKIKAALQVILNDAQAGKVLKDELEGLRSFRVGKFRIVYRIGAKGQTIEIAAIGPRKSIYEETLRLLRRGILKNRDTYQLIDRKVETH
ncbi:MAG TPA: type II toxin-antitoxin system RelE/ParE family toxin [Dissulfurispiraceae bacterium]|nr:type II toxin-antitoxin system RelE/ParE family toxin [Dissulfurispiraceae bacterium]